MYQLHSSNLRSISYDSTTGTLVVEFVSGPIYQFYGIPSFLYKGLLAAVSKGQYFDIHIRKGPYRYQRIGESHSYYA